MPNKMKPDSQTLPWYGKVTTDNVSNMISLGHGGIPMKPYGTLDITENGKYDTSTKAEVNVQVAGQKVEGTIDVTEWSNDIDVSKYAKANVMPLYPSKERTIVANGEYNDMAEYSSVKVAVPTPTGTIDLTEYSDNINVETYQYANTRALEPTGSAELTENGTYNIKDKASVVVNVPGIEPVGTITLDTYANDIDVSKYATADTTALEPTGEKIIRQFSESIDVKSYATVNTAMLEPSGTYNATTYSNTLDIKQYEFVDTTALQPTGEIALDKYESGLDVSKYATADTTALEPKGSKALTEYGASIDVKNVATVDTTALEPNGTITLNKYAADIDVKNYATADTTALEPKGTKVLDTFEADIDVKNVATVDTTGLEPTGSLTIDTYAADIDVKSIATVDTRSLEPKGEYVASGYGAGINISKYAVLNTLNLKPTGTLKIATNGTFDVANKEYVTVSGVFTTIMQALLALGSRDMAYCPRTTSDGTQTWSFVQTTNTCVVYQKGDEKLEYFKGITMDEQYILVYNSVTEGDFELFDTTSDDWIIRRADGNYAIGTNCIFDSVNFENAKGSMIISASKSTTSNQDYQIVSPNEPTIIQGAPSEFNFLPHFNRLIVFGNTDMEYDWSQWLDMETTTQRIAWESNGTSGTYALKVNSKFHAAAQSTVDLKYLMFIVAPKDGNPANVTVTTDNVSWTVPAINDNFILISGVDFANTTITKGTAEMYIYAIAAYDSSVSTISTLDELMEEEAVKMATKDMYLPDDEDN